MTNTKKPEPSPIPAKRRETRGDSLGEIQKMNSKPPVKQPEKKK